MTRDLTGGDLVAAVGLGMPPRPLTGKLADLCSERSSGKAAIDVVLELLCLGVTFAAKPFVMPSRHGKSSDDDSGHDGKDNCGPGSRGHRFMVTALRRPSLRALGLQLGLHRTRRRE
jgi:hypothetical protein